MENSNWQHPHISAGAGANGAEAGRSGSGGLNINGAGSGSSISGPPGPRPPYATRPPSADAAYRNYSRMSSTDYPPYPGEPAPPDYWARSSGGPASSSTAPSSSSYSGNPPPPRQYPPPSSGSWSSAWQSSQQRWPSGQGPPSSWPQAGADATGAAIHRNPPGSVASASSHAAQQHQVPPSYPPYNYNYPPDSYYRGYPPQDPGSSRTLPAQTGERPLAPPNSHASSGPALAAHNVAYPDHRPMNSDLRYYGDGRSQQPWPSSSPAPVQPYPRSERDRSLLPHHPAGPPAPAPPGPYGSTAPPAQPIPWSEWFQGFRSRRSGDIVASPSQPRSPVDVPPVPSHSFPPVIPSRIDVPPKRHPSLPEPSTYYRSPAVYRARTSESNNLSPPLRAQRTSTHESPLHSPRPTTPPSPTDPTGVPDFIYKASPEVVAEAQRPDGYAPSDEEDPRSSGRSGMYGTKKARLRISKKNEEKARRDAFKHHLNELIASIPGMRGYADTRKAVLVCTREYVRQIQSREKRLRSELIKAKVSEKRLRNLVKDKLGDEMVKEFETASADATMEVTKADLETLGREVEMLLQQQQAQSKEQESTAALVDQLEQDARLLLEAGSAHLRTSVKVETPPSDSSGSEVGVRVKRHLSPTLSPPPPSDSEKRPLAPLGHPDASPPALPHLGQLDVSDVVMRPSGEEVALKLERAQEPAAVEEKETHLGAGFGPGL